MLEARGLRYGYKRDQPLFHNLSITIAPGEIVGLSGQSGTGKTTLAKLLAGFAKPDAGHILLDGHALPASGVHPVQLVLQHPEHAVNPRWKMKKILAEGGGAGHNFLETLGISRAWLERYPRELSGGELQRFCLARALGSAADYLIADEMTTMLDAVTQAQIWEAVLHMRNEWGFGVLAISHDQALLKRVADRLVSFPELLQPAD
ncbi:ABC transporter ATP-binding protein [Barrientosiimonas marina]